VRSILSDCPQSVKSTLNSLVAYVVETVIVPGIGGGIVAHELRVFSQPVIAIKIVSPIVKFLIISSDTTIPLVP